MPSLAISPLNGPGYLGSRRLSTSGVAVVIAAHAAVFAIVVSLQVLPPSPAISALMVEILVPAAPQPVIAPPAPQPVQNKPLPQRRSEPQPRKILSTQTDNAAPAVEAMPAREVATPTAAPAAPPATVTQPRFDADYLSNPAPTYPPLSRRMGEEGKVVLRVLVEPNGRPAQIELKSSSGSPRLDQAGQDAVWRWKFVPAKRGDEAISAWVLVPITFTLKN
ncbi:MAG: periplasmic protein TonB [Pseudomonadota bacterium]|nr:periplasmic protein TonB [Pseudomonadota bacterium]